MILNFQGTPLKKSEHIEAGTGNYAIKLKLVEYSTPGVVLVTNEGIKLDGTTRIQFTSAKYHNPFGDWSDFSASDLNSLNSAELWVSPWSDELMLYFSADPYAQFTVTISGVGDSEIYRVEASIYEVKSGGAETELQSNSVIEYETLTISNIKYNDPILLLELRQ